MSASPRRRSRCAGATWCPRRHPSVQMVDRIAAEVKAKSGGRIAVQSFPGGQLGSSRDMIEAVANGTQQIVTRRRRQFRRLGAGHLGGRKPLHLARRRPPGQGDGRPGRRASSTTSSSAKRGMRILGTTYYGTRHVTTSTKAVKTPADLVGFKLRVPRERRVQGDGRGLGRQAHADELRRALSRAEAGHRRRPGESAADDQVRQVRRGAEVPGADRAHHHAAPRGRERSVLEGPEARPTRRSSQDAIDAGIAWQNAELHQAGERAGRDVQGRRHDGGRPSTSRRSASRWWPPWCRSSRQVGQGHLREAART